MGEIQNDVVYGDAGNRPLKLDLYKPDGAGNGGAVILLHGGAWRQGNKNMLVEHAKHLARDGFFVFAAEYRLTPEAPWPAQIHDTKRAIRWVRSQAKALGFDPAKIALQGHSAGAHLALLAAGTADEKRLDPPATDHAVSAAVAAAVGIYPPTLMYVGQNRPSGGTPASALPGSDVSEEAAALASPLSHVRADFPPSMLLHGDQDKTVPVTASLIFDKAMRAAGASVDLHVFGGLPHGFANQAELRPILMTMISGFFRRKMVTPEAFAIAPPAARPARVA